MLLILNYYNDVQLFILYFSIIINLIIKDVNTPQVKNRCYKSTYSENFTAEVTGGKGGVTVVILNNNIKMKKKVSKPYK